MNLGRYGMGLALILLLGLAGGGSAAGAGGAKAPSRVEVRRGERFPDLRFEQLVAPEDYANLGLSRREGAFSLADIPGELLVVEFMNQHCVPCQTQVRRVQELYDALHGQGQFPAVRVLAVAAGNQAKYLPRFREKRHLTYPLAADAKLVQWRRFGEPGRTPLSLFLARAGDHWVLQDYHFGVREEGWLMAETESLLGGAGGDRSPDPAPRVVGPAAPALGARGEWAAAAALLSRVLGHTVTPEPLDLPDGSRLYRGGSGEGAGTVYARVASLEPLCEICHGVHFVYAFDNAGTVRGFAALHVTKWGNQPWAPADEAFFESRLVGRALNDLEFDEAVDAVSRATISSTIIFLEISEAGELLEAARHLP